MRLNPPLLVAFLLGLGGTACAPMAAVKVEVLSTRAAYITGGNVLLGLTVPSGVDADSIQVKLGEQDVSARFKLAPEWTRQAQHADRVALIEGLREGTTAVHVSWNARGMFSGRRATSLPLINHPITGPLLSGPHQTPFLCETEQFVLPTGARLGPPRDAQCSVATQVHYVYRNPGGILLPWPEGAARPEDIDHVVTTDGRRVPFIVRIETGTINRAIYQTAILHDPASAAPDPWHRSDGWNRRLIYTHGGGCRRGWYRQGNSVGKLRTIFLERGYAVASSSLNVFGNNCNDLLASETQLMVKERFIESYGKPLFTIGTGGSGGAYQAHQTADNYPGIFDGILVEDSFPDVVTATTFTMSDARLLQNYFNRVVPGTFSDAQKLAISGFGSLAQLAQNSDGAARIVALPPDISRTPKLTGGEFIDLMPTHLRYAADRTDGARPTIYDHAANVYGRDPATGKAARALDNVGVQYGLAALNAQQITFAQFLDLNAQIGGFDADGLIVSARTVADAGAARAAHTTGRILHGGGGLAFTPVIDVRVYRDALPYGDIHMFVHGFSTRARLEAANGHFDNHVLIVRPFVNIQVPAGDGSMAGEQLRDLMYDDLDRQQLMPYIHLLDRWLTALAADPSPTPAVEKMRRARPPQLHDECWQGEGAAAKATAEPIPAGGLQAGGLCEQLFPIRWTPRHRAGAPPANNILVCARKPVDLKEYPQPLPDDALALLQAVFPQGVCDWSKPDPYQGYAGTWQALPRQ